MSVSSSRVNVDDNLRWQNEAMDYLKEIKRLEKRNFPQLKKIDESIYKEYLSLTNIREENDRKRYKKLKLLKASLDDIQQSVRSIGDTPEDLAYFQNLLEALETKFSIFKGTMSQEFDSLASEEATLNIELSSLALRVDTWEAEEDPQQSRKTSSAQTTEINEHQRQRNEKLNQQRVEIGLIDRKLATLGAKSSGGWDSRDHDLFLRSWAQSGITFIPTASNESSTAPTDENLSSTPSHISQIPPKQLHALRKRLTPLLPGLDPEAIDQHIEWYLEVQYLLQAKKSLLNSWKYEKKLSEEEKEISTTSRGSQKSSPGKGNDDDIEKQEKRRLEIKKKLMNWQKEKEDERKNEEAEEQKKLETARRFSEQSLLERQQTNRMKLQSWREEREKNKEVERAHSPPVKPRPKSADPEQIRRRHLQNLEKAKEKHQKVQESRDGLKARYDRQMELGKMASLSVVGEHVESKLYSSTKASDSQRMTSEELDAAEIRRQGKGAHEKRVAYGGYDLKYVGRAIPAWTRPP